MILLLSENETLSKQIQSDLTSEGFDVEVQSNIGKTLIELNTQKPIDSVLLDFDLKQQDAFDVCQQIKKHPHLQYAPLIIVLEKSGVVDQLLSFEMGADDFMYTPYSQLEMQLKMRSVRRLIGLQKELQQKDAQLENLKNIQRVMVTLNHYINNALTPLYFAVQMLEDPAQHNGPAVHEIARDTVEFISKVLRSLNKIVQSGRIKVVQEGIYKDIMFDIDQELNRLLEKAPEM